MIDVNGNSSVDSTFMERFYQSPEVEYDSLTKSAKLTFDRIKNSHRESRRGFARELRGSFAAFPCATLRSAGGSSQKGVTPAEMLPNRKNREEAVDPEGDILFVEDSAEWKNTQKKALSKRTKVSLFLLLVAIPVTVLVGMYFFRNAGYSPDQSFLAKLFGSRIYYAISLVITVYSLVPFFMVFEGRKPQARELVILATMIALNVAGRAAFFMVPDFKPIYAITIISGIAFGGEAGFLVGSMSILVSNFLFGQGPWTPWQMLAMGLIGFLSGILYQKGLLPTKKLPLAIYGFLMGFIVYGGIMNPAGMFMAVGEPNWKTLLAYYISGVPVDLIKGASTFIFLWIGANPMLDKLQRIKVKYGLIN